MSVGFDEDCDVVEFDDDAVKLDEFFNVDALLNVDVGLMHCFIIEFVTTMFGDVFGEVLLFDEDNNSKSFAFF